jgi:hypothetical protein
LACPTRYVSWWKEEDECGKREQQVAGGEGEFPSWQQSTSLQLDVDSEHEMEVGFGMAGGVMEVGLVREQQARHKMSLVGIYRGLVVEDGQWSVNYLLYVGSMVGAWYYE